MRKLLNRQVVIYALSIALLFILGFEVHQNTYAADQEQQTVYVEDKLKTWEFLSAWNTPAFYPYLNQTPEQTAFPLLTPIRQYSTHKEQLLEQTSQAAGLVPQNHQSILAQTDAYQGEQNKSTVPPRATKLDVNQEQYEVTAYYLNVRSKPNASSSIVNVVEKDTILEIIQELDNGWLQLQGEGYVNGHYTKKATKTAAQAKQQARNVAADKQAAVELPKDNVKTLSLTKSKPQKPNSKVSSSSGLTVEHIERMFKGTALANQDLEETIMSVEEEYGINAYFTIAVMKLESGNGKSRLAKEHNNLFGLNATGGSNRQAFRFEEKKDSVEKFGQLLSRNYVKKGYTSVEKVAGKYCPVDPDWPDMVTSIMNSDYRKIRDTF